MALSRSKEKIIRNAKRVISIEKKAISELQRRFNDPGFVESFTSAVETIYKCKGKIVVTGIGKSGIISQKIVATFNSTGTYSTFLHSGDSVHGDLGMVREEDVVLLISKSGDTTEVKKLIPIFKSLKVKIIAIVGDVNSELAKVSHIVIDASVKEEACPHNLAPTSSTTASLVIGDALAISLLQKKGFTEKDFASFHPGGNLGKKLLLKVEDIMTSGSDIPAIEENDSLKDVIYEISSKRLGCTCVVKGKTVRGIITDGDIRRRLERNIDLRDLTAKELMSKSPKLIPETTLAQRALVIMQNNKITQLIVVDKNKKLSGMIHMHKLIELGL